MIRWDQPVETTEDPPRPVRVLGEIAGQANKHIVAIYRHGAAVEVLYQANKRGEVQGAGGLTIRNVAPPKPEPVLYEGWVNLSSDGSVCTWMRKEDADATAGRKRVECRHIVWNSDGSPVDDDPRGEVVDVELLEKVEAEVNHWKAKAEADLAAARAALRDLDAELRTIGTGSSGGERYPEHAAAIAAAREG